MRKDRNTGMVRNVDALGRIVLPMELRRTLGIDFGNPFKYFVEEDDERLILRKSRTQECMFCSSKEGLSYFKEYFICGSCLDQVPETTEGGAASNPEVDATLEKISKH
ncbi:AbrB/MazE/SpoVT family DNA-binding domain-containing protein [Paenibacillus sp. PK1-4R]|uniref:AbrB/MazE/SpoVT family DNA-binding domain-containing protein n=1 Tax=Paenibacillus sp. PK1-4R TaxID=3049075 RepID=UPI0025A06E50|nr:AbrB/MazE/SpoVT family DNA-binding domain-containing protein [Paenibacillus sp. PK1-4R]WJM05860.1 AbrB/MazE/SpoVT family DNA-binding domain-containing protein [Paenibacillus sp. PK1-4R]